MKKRMGLMSLVYLVLISGLSVNAVEVNTDRLAITSRDVTHHKNTDDLIRLHANVISTETVIHSPIERTIDGINTNNNLNNTNDETNHQDKNSDNALNAVTVEKENEAPNKDAIPRDKFPSLNGDELSDTTHSVTATKETTETAQETTETTQESTETTQPKPIPPIITINDVSILSATKTIIDDHNNAVIYTNQPLTLQIERKTDRESTLPQHAPEQENTVNYGIVLKEAKTSKLYTFNGEQWQAIETVADVMFHANWTSDVIENIAWRQEIFEGELIVFARSRDEFETVSNGYSVFVHYESDQAASAMYTSSIVPATFHVMKDDMPLYNENAAVHVGHQEQFSGIDTVTIEFMKDDAVVQTKHYTSEELEQLGVVLKQNGIVTAISNWYVPLLLDGQLLQLRVSVKTNAGNIRQYIHRYSKDITSPKITLSRTSNQSFVTTETIKISVQDDTVSVNNIVVKNNGQVLLVNWQTNELGHIEGEFTVEQEGQHTIDVHVADVINHTQEQQLPHFVVDRTPPKIIIEHNGEWRNEQFQTLDHIVVTIDELHVQNQEIVLLRNQQINTVFNTESLKNKQPLHIPILTDGHYVLTVRAIDLANNYNEQQLSFIKDTQIDYFNVLNIDERGVYVKQPFIQIVFDDLHKATLSMQVMHYNNEHDKHIVLQQTHNNAHYLAQSFHQQPLQEGHYTLTVHSFDNAGNQATLTKNFLVSNGNMTLTKQALFQTIDNFEMVKDTKIIINPVINDMPQLIVNSWTPIETIKLTAMKDTRVLPIRYTTEMTQLPYQPYRMTIYLEKDDFLLDGDYQLFLFGHNTQGGTLSDTPIAMWQKDTQAPELVTLMNETDKRLLINVTDNSGIAHLTVSINGTTHMTFDGKKEKTFTTELPIVVTGDVTVQFVITDTLNNVKTIDEQYYLPTVLDAIQSFFNSKQQDDNIDDTMNKSFQVVEQPIQSQQTATNHAMSFTNYEEKSSSNELNHWWVAIGVIVSVSGIIVVYHFVNDNKNKRQ